MLITSFYFYLFCIAVIIIYHIVPKGLRWGLLLIASLVFYFLSAPAYTILYLVVSVLSVYLATIGFKKIEPINKTSKNAVKKMIFALALIINVSLVVLLKYLGFILWNVNSILEFLRGTSTISCPDIVASLGISYYAFQLIGYLCDVYWGLIEPQENPLKLLLFGCYFPQMTSGPINRYSDLAGTLYSGASVDYNATVKGLIRSIWGIFKKLVVAERLSVFVCVVYGNPFDYSASLIWMASFAFSLQLYADFSGCMDIIMGVSECLGIKLTENFDTPFFSQNIQEFWQRWHISLGAWFRNYVMYPFLDSKPMIKCETALKNTFGKKKGKRYSSYIGMLIVWLCIGIWHGSGWKYIVGEGLWYWLMIVLGKELKPVFDKLVTVCHINTDCFAWRVFRSIRTFIIFTVGMIFFRAASMGEAIDIIRLSFMPGRHGLSACVGELGIEIEDVCICLLGLAAMLIVSGLHIRGSLRDRLLSSNIFIRWLVLYTLIFAVILFGQYGPGYSATEFIYQGF